MFFYVCLAIGIVSLIMFLSQRKPEVTLKVLLIKTVTSVLFILTSFAAFYENENCSTVLALLFFSGAVCGLLGDIWLDAKYIFKTEEKGLLNAGFISFLIGHLFFIAGMLITYKITALLVICGVIGAVFGVVSCFVTEKVLKADFGSSKLISIVYTSILTFTTGVSLAIAIENDFEVATLVRFIGMLLFLGSDAVLAKIYFCKGQNTRVNVVVNHALYYLAQFSLAASLFFVGD